jgi:hypothetical protein
VSGQDRQHQGPQNIPKSRGIGAGIAQRAVGNKGFIETADFQKLDEERLLPQRGDGRFRIPFNMDATGKSIDGDPR